MTLREWIAWTYPLHYQRILEEGYAQSRKSLGVSTDFGTVLDGPPGRFPLAQCFVWARTSEGHDYWQRLSREPFTSKKARIDQVDWDTTW